MYGIHYGLPYYNKVNHNEFHTFSDTFSFRWIKHFSCNKLGYSWRLFYCPDLVVNVHWDNRVATFVSKWEM